MSYFKFTDDDIYDNIIELNPLKEIAIMQSGVYVDRKIEEAPSVLTSSIIVYPINGGTVRRDNADQIIYPLSPKTSDLVGFMSSPNNENNIEYGDLVTGSYLSQLKHQRWYLRPQYDLVSDSSLYVKFTALKTSILKYKNLWKFNNAFFAYSGSFFPLIDHESVINYLYTYGFTVLMLPRAYFGSSIQKKSTYLSFYANKKLVATAEDLYGDGLLRLTYSLYNPSYTGSTMGMVLYDEGTFLFFETVDLDTEYFYYEGSQGPDSRLNPYHFGAAPSSLTDTDINYSDYYIKFRGTTTINTKTIFCKAPAGKLNSTTNPSYIEWGQQTLSASYTQYSFCENDNLLIKNIPSASWSEEKYNKFQKQTFISYINLYNADKKHYAVAKLATPILKKENESYCFKLTLDS